MIMARQKIEEKIFKKKAFDLAVFLSGSINSNHLGLLSYYFIGTRKSSLIIFTALLICMENSFWKTRRDNNFLELFKKSCAVYVTSGMMMKTEADIKILRNELEGGYPVAGGFKARFYRIITAHYLPRPENQAYGLERKNE